MAVAGTREAKQIERRGRIITEAMRLARDGGYDAVHMRAVAERAEVALGTIYRYFGSKDVLLLEGLAGWIRVIGDDIVAAGIAGATPSARVIDVVTRASKESDQEPMLMSALVNALTSTDPLTIDARARVDQYFGRLLRTALGDVPDDLDVQGVLRVIGHVWFGAVTTWVAGRAPDGHVGEELTNAVVQTLGAP